MSCGPRYDTVRPVRPELSEKRFHLAVLHSIGTERLLVVLRLGDFRESLNGDSANIKLPGVNYWPLMELSVKAASAKGNCDTFGISRCIKRSQ